MVAWLMAWPDTDHLEMKSGMLIPANAGICVIKTPKAVQPIENMRRADRWRAVILFDVEARPEDCAPPQLMRQWMRSAKSGSHRGRGKHGTQERTISTLGSSAAARTVAGDDLRICRALRACPV